jgi:hypothetical protein
VAMTKGTGGHRVLMADSVTLFDDFSYGPK